MPRRSTHARFLPIPQHDAKDHPTKGYLRLGNEAVSSGQWRAVIRVVVVEVELACTCDAFPPLSIFLLMLSLLILPRMHASLQYAWKLKITTEYPSYVLILIPLYDRSPSSLVETLLSICIRYAVCFSLRQRRPPVTFFAALLQILAFRV